MTVVRLRPHHLLCIQNFEGLGYSDEFVENMERVVSAALGAGDVKVVEGEDDVCAVCGEDCDEADVARRDAAVLEALREPTVEAARALPEDERRRVCSGCSWFETCYR